MDHVVDVGAALGGYSWVLSRRARKVVAYEPGIANGDYLELATRHSNIELVRAAVGASAGVLKLYTAGASDADRFTATLSTANPVASMAGRQSRDVPVITLDEDLPPRLFAAFRAGVDTWRTLSAEGADLTGEGFRDRMLARFLSQRPNVGREDMSYLLERLDIHPEAQRQDAARAA